MKEEITWLVLLKEADQETAEVRRLVGEFLRVDEGYLPATAEGIRWIPAARPPGIEHISRIPDLFVRVTPRGARRGMLVKLTTRFAYTYQTFLDSVRHVNDRERAKLAS